MTKKKDRQYNDQKEGQTIWPKRKTDNIMTKKTYNGRQNTTMKTKDWATWTPLKKGMNSGAPDEWAVPAPLVASVIFFVLKIWW